MARLHFVKKARKTIRGKGIRRGDSYWWWKHSMRHSRQVSKTKPRRSQLTLSEFYAAMWDAEDSIQDALKEGTKSGDFSSVVSAFRAASSTVEEQGDSCDQKLDNMPENLQQGETGRLLEARRDGCGDLARDLEDCADDVEAMLGEANGDGSTNNVASRVEEVVNGITWEVE